MGVLLGKKKKSQQRQMNLKEGVHLMKRVQLGEIRENYRKDAKTGRRCVLGEATRGSAEGDGKFGKKGASEKPITTAKKNVITYWRKNV